MRKVVLSKEVEDYLRHEYAYLARFNQRSANLVVQQIWAAFRMLALHPQAGTLTSHLTGRRQYVTGAYVITYRAEPDAINISYVRHGRQQAPDLEKDADIDDVD